VETSVQIGSNDYLVVIDSDTNIDKIVPTKNTLHFDASGSAGETGYIKVVFPMVNTTSLKVFIDGVKLSPPPFPIINTDGTNYYVYFEFMLSTHTVAIQFAPITATIDIDPDRLNLLSNGQWITSYAYIELPEGFGLNDINVSSIMLNNSIPVDLSAPATIGDYDNDGIPDLMAKFDRAEVVSYILSHVNMPELIKERFMTVTLSIAGNLNDGTAFQGSISITIILPTPRWGRFIPII